MSVLTDEQRADIHARAMSDFSSARTITPVSKSQLRTLINLMDVELEAAETSIISGLPAGAGKTWLLANQPIGRELLARIERKRQEVL